MNICGRDGHEMRCCKTGLVIHDLRYAQSSRHAADMFYCPQCGNLYIKRNSSDYHITDCNLPVHLTMNEGVMLWEPSFAMKMREQYGLRLVNM